MRDPEIERLRHSLGEWALGDVKRAFEGDAVVGAFLLAAHLIDVLAGLAYSKKGTAPGPEAWAEFVPAYMPRYAEHHDLLYSGFRSALSHRYTLEGVHLTHGPDDRSRHWESENGVRCLHFETFLEDVEAAVEQFFTDAEDVEAMRRRVFPRLLDSPLMGLKRITVAGSARAASGAAQEFADAEASGPVYFPTYTSLPTFPGDAKDAPKKPRKMAVLRGKVRKHGRQGPSSPHDSD